MTLYLVTAILDKRRIIFDADALDILEDGDWGQCDTFYILKAESEKHACELARKVHDD